MGNTHTTKRKKGKGQRPGGNKKKERIFQGSHYGFTSFFVLLFHWYDLNFPGPDYSKQNWLEHNNNWYSLSLVPFPLINIDQRRRMLIFWISKDTYATETAVVWLPPEVTLDPDVNSSSTTIFCLAGPIKWSKRFIGMGKMMVELCSAAILLKVWRYRSCNYKVVDTISEPEKKQIWVTREPADRHLLSYWKKGQRFMSPLPLILKRPLAVIYLQGRGALGNNVSSFPQGSWSLLLTLSCNHLEEKIVKVKHKKGFKYFIYLTLARASLAASASAAIALCNCTGKRTSLLEINETFIVRPFSNTVELHTPSTLYIVYTWTRLFQSTVYWNKHAKIIFIKKVWNFLNYKRE